MVSESRIVRLDKVSYLCTVILNYSNYGTKQETIKQQAKVRRGLIGDNEAKEMINKESTL